jgi:hypothetical protein
MSKCKGDDKCIQNCSLKMPREETIWETRHRQENNIQMNLRELGVKVWSECSSLWTGPVLGF